MRGVDEYRLCSNEYRLCSTDSGMRPLRLRSPVVVGGAVAPGRAVLNTADCGGCNAELLTLDGAPKQKRFFHFYMSDERICRVMRCTICRGAACVPTVESQTPS
jgi:hypothetical protein